MRDLRMSASGVQCGSMSGQFVGHIGAFHCPERNFFANEINECDLRGTIRRTLEDFFGRLQTFGEPMYWTILPKLAERAGQCRTIRRTLGHSEGQCRTIRRTLGHSEKSFVSCGIYPQRTFAEFEWSKKWFTL